MKDLKQEESNQNENLENQDCPLSGPLNSKNQKIDALNNNQNPKLDSKNISLNIKK